MTVHLANQTSLVEQTEQTEQTVRIEHCLLSSLPLLQPSQHLTVSSKFWHNVRNSSLCVSKIDLNFWLTTLLKYHWLTFLEKTFSQNVPLLSCWFLSVMMRLGLKVYPGILLTFSSISFQMVKNIAYDFRSHFPCGQSDEFPHRYMASPQGQWFEILTPGVASIRETGFSFQGTVLSILIHGHGNSDHHYSATLEHICFTN